ncbi:MAG TPA: response regulator transcription factor [Nocardioidaceae bacterium]|nr:response regulator transcription factor [Nocardioidaceae bacterium]
MTVRVLVADDQELVRQGLETIVGAQDDLEVVGGAADGREAVRLAAELRPDVVLMDIRMPGMDGLEATRLLLARPEFSGRILVLTTFDADEHVFAALQAGASGFLLKDVPRRRLVEAIRAVHDGDVILAPAITRRLVERHLDTGRHDDGHRAALDRLSAREVDVLELLARGSSNQEIAARLHLSESTIKTHVGALLQKLSVRDRVQLVIFGYEAGLVRPGT